MHKSELAYPTSNKTNKGGGVLQAKKSCFGGYGSRSFSSEVVLNVTGVVNMKDIDAHLA